MCIKREAYVHERRSLCVRKEEPMCSKGGALCMKGGAYMHERRSLCA